MSVLA